jgi:putative Mg2+ transporter-C (MgtC) family protein
MIGASGFTGMGVHLAGADGAVRIIAYVVSGIGFLGAGVIMKDGTSVRGLNTAATLWCSAAVGAFTGAGLGAEAGAMTIFVLAGNTLLRPLVNYINRRPMDEKVTEALYRVHIVSPDASVAEARNLLYTELEKMSYPIRTIEVLSTSDDQVELAAILVPTTANPDELDMIVTRLGHSPHVESAAWTVSTTS